jgi:hypothetical protein
MNSSFASDSDKRQMFLDLIIGRGRGGDNHGRPPGRVRSTTVGRHVDEKRGRESERRRERPSDTWDSPVRTDEKTGQKPSFL